MSSDQHVSLLVPEIITYTRRIQVIDGICCILLLLSIVGNMLGLFIFSSSRRTWRISSIYAFLATCSSIMNLLCAIRYAVILHSTSRSILQRLIVRTWWACKFYEFTFSFRIISSWITLFWMFERVICVSTRFRSIFDQCNSFKLKFIIPIVILIIILICVIGPPVYMYQPELIPNNNTMNSTIDMMYCDVNSKASIEWKKYFHEIHIGMNHFTIRCLFSELIPTGAVILFDSCIFYHLIRIHRRLHQSTSRSGKEKSQTTLWMNIVLILHSFLFLVSVLSHIAGHFIAIEAHEAWWVLLAVLINCSLNFYIYCLSGKAFRHEIRRLIHRLKTRLSSGTQTQQSSENPRLNYEMCNLQGVGHL